MTTTKGVIDQPLTQKQQLSIEASKQAASIVVGVIATGKLVGVTDWVAQIVNLYKTLHAEGYKKMTEAI